MNVVHGPEALLDTRFKSPIPGFALRTVNVSVAVLPFVGTPAIVAEITPLVLT
jgi:hypothetical protein